MPEHPRPLLRADDLTPGSVIPFGSYVVTLHEIIALASAWDPLPIHVNAAAASKGPHGDLIASGIHTLAVAQRLAVAAAYAHWDVIAGREVTRLRLLRPVLPGWSSRGA